MRSPGIKGTLTLCLLSQVLVVGLVDASSKKSKEVYNAEVPQEDAQRISIVIGNKDAVEEQDPRISNSINADGDDEGGDDSTSPPREASETTSFEECANGKCCFQYTWPGYRTESNLPTTPSNATCEYLWAAAKDDAIACFDPLVYTRAKNPEQPLYTPPDIHELFRSAQANNWNIFCHAPDKSCVTYTYYSRGGGKAIANQTKFCGIVTNVNTGGRIENGCHREKVEGYIREVCVCSSPLCNGSSVRQPQLLTLATMVVLLRGLTSLLRIF